MGREKKKRKKKEPNCYVWIHTTLPDQTENPNFGTKAAWSPVFINLKKLQFTIGRWESVTENVQAFKIITQNPDLYITK